MSRPTAWSLALLALILLVGVGLRFWGLGSRGLILFDAAYYANAAKTPAYALEWLGDRSATKGSLREYLQERGAIGFPLKPGYVLLLAAGFLVAGVRDFVVLGISAGVSLFTIVVIYVIGRRFFDGATAVTAAALFTVSGNSVAFARTGYAQATAVLVLAFATYSYLRSAEAGPAVSRWLVAAGLASGFGLLVHQASVLGIAAFFLADLGRVVIQRELSWVSWRQRALWFGAGLLAPYALAALVYRLAGGSLLALDAVSVAAGALRIAEGARELVGIQLARSGGWTGVLGENAEFLARMFATLETPLFWGAALAGLGVLTWRAIRHRSLACLLLTGQVLIPFLYGVVVYSTLKAVQVGLPALALAGGLALGGIARRLTDQAPRRAAAIATFLVVGVLALGVVWVRPWVAYRTGYQEMVRQLIAYMAREGGTLSVPDQGNLAPLLAFYLGEAVRSLPAGFKGRIEFTGHGGDYAVVDYQRLIKGDPEPLRRLVDGRQVVVRVANVEAMLPVYHVHRAVPTARFPSYRVVLACAPCDEMAPITVYDLRKPVGS